MKLCAIGIHAWERWGEPVIVAYERYDRISGLTLTSSGPIEFSRLEQDRACRGCGKVQRRVVPT